MIKLVKAKLVNTTNSGAKKYLNEVRKCSINQFNQLLMEREDGHCILTSKIHEYSQRKNIVLVKTLNSIYELEIIGDRKYESKNR